MWSAAPCSLIFTLDQFSSTNLLTSSVWAAATLALEIGQKCSPVITHESNLVWNYGSDSTLGTAACRVNGAVSRIELCESIKHTWLALPGTPGKPPNWHTHQPFPAEVQVCPGWLGLLPLALSLSIHSHVGAHSHFHTCFLCFPVFCWCTHGHFHQQFLACRGT